MSPATQQAKRSRKRSVAAENDARRAELAACKRCDAQGFDDAWVGLEPTFSTRKAVEKWARMAEKKGGEDAYFESRLMRGTVHKVGHAIRKRYRELARKGDPACPFAGCELEFDRDPWDVERANLHFGGPGKGDFEVRFGLDPETFEFSLKPVPLAWLYDPRFARFLARFLWEVPQEQGLRVSTGHGGGQFSFSAKTFLQGSLLADDIATKVNHPELATWIFSHPDVDGRAFRATAARRRAFERVLDDYWSGAFHPRAIGTLTAANALLDRGFGPAAAPPAGLVDPRGGPIGGPRDVFQTNFAFGRTVRWSAQNVEPGYWQAMHPDEDGYRPDQIMRYGEGNLNRLQIAGEWHVKSGKVLDVEEVPELDAPLELDMLYGEASWEQRAHTSDARAEDMVEAVLLDAHHARYLLEHPHVRVVGSLLQDQILGDAERTLALEAPERLAKLKRKARKENLAASRGRVHSEWIEPEILFWEAWHALAPGGRAEIAVEALGGLIERVENAAAKDPRGRDGDPMEAHRHRVHPLLWEALEGDGGAQAARADVAREAQAWRDKRATYLARRPRWSVTRAKPPWKRGR